jgi:hypothetical protein
MRRYVLGCSLLMLFFMPGLAAAQTPLPADNAIAGWKKSEPQKTFNQADLYGYIDGGAELFLEFGFEQLVVQKYKSGGDEITVEMYRMTDPVAAAGIHLMKMGKETPELALRDRNSINNYQLMFLRNRYFTIVNNLGGKEALRPTMLRFASVVAGSMPAATPIPEVNVLPKRALVASSVRLLRGAYGLQAVYTLGDGDILQLGRTTTAVSGDYKDASGSYTLILADYPDAAAARKALAYLQSNLDKYSKITTKQDAGFVFQDYQKKFGVVRLVGKRLEIKVHLVKAPA